MESEKVVVDRLGRVILRKLRSFSYTYFILSPDTHGQRDKFATEERQTFNLKESNQTK